MAAEQYQFEYAGASFYVMSDTTSPATTTEPPNVRTMIGAWKTWRIEVDNAIPGIEGVRIIRSVGATTSTPHPAGNLTEAQSGSIGSMVMATASGVIYGIPSGFGTVHRLLTNAEWNDLRAGWENNLQNWSTT